MRRPPAVAGQFYAGTSSRLTGQVEQYVLKGQEKEEVIAALSPHAGLMYSGPVAGAVYSSIRFPRTFLLIGPNHTGVGADLSLMPSGQWEIPTGTFGIDEALGSAILRHAPGVTGDAQAHRFEHSLEVQLPFIAYFSTEVMIVPLAVLTCSLDECRNVGRGIAAAIREVSYEVVIVASTDMSHYVPDATARRLDGLALKEVLDLNPEGLYTTVRKERISMCGVLPATIALYAAKALGARTARLVRYATSGDVSGDHDHVVGYAGVVIKA
jgi:hypothetical protein